MNKDDFLAEFKKILDRNDIHVSIKDADVIYNSFVSAVRTVLKNKKTLVLHNFIKIFFREQKEFKKMCGLHNKEIHSPKKSVPVIKISPSLKKEFEEIKN